ncbi:hypothetical protein AB8Y43_15180, partial [Listeria monocytogenes]|uniref:hypothetical protein n=1 Tax=Listeria monocytogenes TaxID=1639 RepID=UPI00350E380C
AASKNVGVKGAAALSISHGSITADASIAADNTVVPAPVIKTQGNISVISDVINKKIVSNASAGVNSTTKDPTSTSTSATIGASAAVAIYDVGHYSRAYVGDGADLTGSRVAVNAYTTIPVSIMLSNWSSANQVFLDAYRAVVDNPGLFTSGAKATAESNELSLAGSYNHFNVGVDTIAWIGSNARITSTIALSQWTVQKLDSIGVSTTDGGNPVRYSFGQSVDIGATT